MQVRVLPISRISGQLVPMSTHQNDGRRAFINFVVDGCAVSVTSAVDNNDEPLEAVKAILLSAYGTSMTKA